MKTQNKIAFEIGSFELNANGITVEYTQDSEDKTIFADIYGACYLLHKTGYIKRYFISTKTGEVMIKVIPTEDVITREGRFEITEAEGVSYTMPWNFFVRNYDIDAEWAMKMIPFHKMHDSVYL